MSLTPFSRLLLACVILLSGCINDNANAPLLDGEEVSGSEVQSRDSEEGTAGEDAAGEDAAGEDAAGEDVAGEDAAGEDAAGEDAAGEDAAGEVVVSDPPPPPQDLSPCDRFCQRVEDCIYPSCDAISQIPSEQFCRGWCQGASSDWLDEGAEQSCEDFTRRMYGFSPELRTLCEADPDVDACEVICDFGSVCGLVSEDCLANCNSATSQEQLCFRSASDSADCRRFLQCFDQPMRPRDPDDAYEEVCTNLCEREATCVFNACAPGTVDSSTVIECVETCVDDQPSQEVLIRRYQLSCEEIVDNTLAEDSALAERCELPEDELCSTLCTERVLGCGSLEADECELRCQSWDDANYLCLQSAGSCNEIAVCLLDQEEQNRCRRSCDHLQSCLEAACPPRIIPPALTDSCTADCFADPISEEDLSEWEETGCRQVREVIYQDNPQLRPICEGNQDFRPSPEECTAFCEMGLDDCVIGDEIFCQSVCASMDRTQYSCALEAQGDCTLIDMCL